MGDRDSRHEKHDRDTQGWRQERSFSPVVTPIQTKDMPRRGWSLDTLERRLAHYTPLPPIKPKKVTPKVHKGMIEHLLSTKPEKITPETHEGRLEQYTPFPSILPKQEIHNRDNQERRKENSSYPITILSRTTDVPSRKVTPKVHKGIFEHLLSMKPEKIIPEVHEERSKQFTPYPSMKHKKITHEGRLEQYTPFPSILLKQEIHNRDNQDRRKENSSYPITILSRTTDVPSSTGYGSIFSDRGISTVNTNIEDNKQDVTYFPATPPYEEKQTKRPLELHGYSFGRENFEQMANTINTQWRCPVCRIRCECLNHLDKHVKDFATSRRGASKCKSWMHQNPLATVKETDREWEKQHKGYLSDNIGDISKTKTSKMLTTVKSASSFSRQINFGRKNPSPPPLIHSTNNNFLKSSRWPWSEEIDHMSFDFTRIPKINAAIEAPPLSNTVLIPKMIKSYSEKSFIAKPAPLLFSSQPMDVAHITATTTGTIPLQTQGDAPAGTTGLSIVERRVERRYRENGKDVTETDIWK